MNAADSNGVWRNHSKQWQKVGAPLRPSVQDGELMMQAAGPALALPPFDNDQVIVAILGVTPEIVSLPWPSHVRLEAFDQSAEMIANVWQPHPHVRSAVTQAYWQKLPLSNQSVRLLVGDAVFNALPSLADCSEVLLEFVRVLEGDGIACVRCFIRPEPVETIETIASDARAGKIQTFHAFKWRIAMSLCQAPDFSVEVADIFAAFEALFPNRLDLARRTNWPIETINTIDVYRDATTRYNFPTMRALQEICAPFFKFETIHCGDYELAERCPTVRLRSFHNAPTSIR